MDWMLVDQRNQTFEVGSGPSGEVWGGLPGGLSMRRLPLQPAVQRSGPTCFFPISNSSSTVATEFFTPSPVQSPTLIAAPALQYPITIPIGPPSRSIHRFPSQRFPAQISLGPTSHSRILPSSEGYLPSSISTTASDPSSTVGRETQSNYSSESHAHTPYILKGRKTHQDVDGTEEAGPRPIADITAASIPPTPLDSNHLLFGEQHHETLKPTVPLSSLTSISSTPSASSTPAHKVRSQSSVGPAAPIFTPVQAPRYPSEEPLASFPSNRNEPTVQLSGLTPILSTPIALPTPVPKIGSTRSVTLGDPVLTPVQLPRHASEEPPDTFQSYMPEQPAVQRSGPTCFFPISNSSSTVATEFFTPSPVQSPTLIAAPALQYPITIPIGPPSRSIHRFPSQRFPAQISLGPTSHSRILPSSEGYLPSSISTTASDPSSTVGRETQSNYSSESHAHTPYILKGRKTHQDVDGTEEAGPRPIADITAASIPPTPLDSNHLLFGEQHHETLKPTVPLSSLTSISSTPSASSTPAHKVRSQSSVGPAAPIFTPVQAPRYPSEEPLASFPSNRNEPTVQLSGLTPILSTPIALPTPVPKIGSTRSVTLGDPVLTPVQLPRHASEEPPDTFQSYMPEPTSKASSLTLISSTQSALSTPVHQIPPPSSVRSAAPTFTPVQAPRYPGEEPPDSFPGQPLSASFQPFDATPALSRTPHSMISPSPEGLANPLCDAGSPISGVFKKQLPHLTPKFQRNKNGTGNHNIQQLRQSGYYPPPPWALALSEIPPTLDPSSDPAPTSTMKPKNTPLGAAEAAQVNHTKGVIFFSYTRVKVDSRLVYAGLLHAGTSAAIAARAKFHPTSPPLAHVCAALWPIPAESPSTDQHSHASSWGGRGFFSVDKYCDDRPMDTKFFSEPGVLPEPLLVQTESWVASVDDLLGWCDGVLNMSRSGRG
ncbi:hypothetical protein BDK51DRAFT_37318 [Blyttiomyces helicus]|uniref:Uncharacterized protein n=1 Tax=Blyttiomyces helicus TaxID=388810 RepID=A0A4P9WHV1_9FUNG|nr:hypothetical protein BDK51DRAFT_37318 [Blyttiomyces helicus]|eukprot:RKO91545.1 hypothetical protein BDK51DRAFT_37318 [Blyttiomyces helicus]